MPQLDTATFLSQFFWTAFFFSAFYLIWVRVILPTLATIVKIRQKRIQWCQNNLGSMESQAINVQKQKDNLLIKAIHTSKLSFFEFKKKITSWLDTQILKTEQSLAQQDIQKKFINSALQISLANELTQQQFPKINEIEESIYKYIDNLYSKKI
jgi:hypothetical protein